MNRCLIGFAPVVLLALQFACTQAPPQTPSGTRAADEKTIRDMESAWAKEMTAKDMDKTMAHYADDASALMTNVAISTGKDSIRELLKGPISDPNFALDLRTAKVEVSKAGDLAYSQGAYTYTFTDPKSRKVLREQGKYVEVYRKQADGSWKVVEDMNNADAPAK